MKKYLVFLPNNILYLNNFGLWIFRAVKHDEKICTVMVVKNTGCCLGCYQAGTGIV